MKKRRFISWTLVFLATPTILWAQGQLQRKNESIYAILQDIKGDRLEGYLDFHPDELIVSTKDDQEKSIPLKIIESIKVEKVQGGVPGADPLGKETYYFVRLQNSKEIFTLKKKYTFRLNTSAGVVTKTIDPQTVHDLSRKDSSSAKS